MRSGELSNKLKKNHQHDMFFHAHTYTIYYAVVSNGFINIVAKHMRCYDII